MLRFTSTSTILVRTVRYGYRRIHIHTAAYVETLVNDVLSATIYFCYVHTVVYKNGA
jgi:hypothetical protein